MAMGSIEIGVIGGDSGTENFKVWTSTKGKLTSLRLTWIIDDYSLRVDERGQSISSPIFHGESNNEVKWVLHLFPFGVNGVIGNSPTVFVDLRSCNSKEIHALYKISILNTLSKHIISYKTPAARIFRPGFISEHNNFAISRNFMANPEYGIDPEDTLIVHFKITVVEKLTIPEPQCTLHSDLGTSLEDQMFSDVILCAKDGKEFKAHKVILSARSPVFKAMFSHNMEENRSNRVEITDIDHEILQEMLRYIYTGEAPRLEEFASELIFAADKYALECLKCMCIKELYYTRINIDNVVQIFQVAYFLDIKELKVHVKDFMTAHASEIFNIDGWRSIFQHPDFFTKTF